MATCASCGRDNLTGALLCASCGAALKALEPDFRGTMVGMPPRAVRAEALPPEAPKADLGKTQLGYGAAVATPTPPAAGSSAAVSPAPAPAADAEARPVFQRTLLGIATPGIAPTGAGMPLRPARPSEAGTTVAPPAPTHHVPSVHPPRSLPPSISARPTVHPLGLKPAWIGAALLGAAAFGGGLALLQKKTPRLVVTAFEVTADGADRLVVRCDDCKPGWRLKLGTQTIALEGGTARLEPPTRLSVGANHLQVVLLDAAGQSVGALDLTVPVAFRVETDLEGRHADPPFAEVVVAAPPGSQVSIDGQPLPLTDGRARRALVLEEATGETSKVVPIAREVPVTVVAGSSTKRTVARVQTAIVPLELTTPGDGHVLSTGALTVSGRTLPGARVRVAVQEAVADKAGEFSLVLSAPGPGTLRVRAETDALVTRTATVELLSSRGAQAFVKDPATLALGANVEIGGRVVESRIAQGRTTALIETARGCAVPPCLLRVLHGQRVQLAPGQLVSARGQVLFLEPLTLRATELK